MSTIQWFPGHMAKAIRQMEENIHLVDIVFELVDARIPAASRNPEVARISAHKPHLIILTKKDLADPQQTAAWLAYYRAQHQPAIAIDSRANVTPKQITKLALNLLADKLAAEKDKGLKPRAIRAMTVGVPNVGKSTLLNHLVRHKAAQVGDTPGVTKGQQWLRSSQHLELLDTPGILWPKFKDQEMAQKLALTGAIKEKLYAKDDVALFALGFFRQYHVAALQQRYRLNAADLELSDVDLLLKITANLGMRDDYERASERLILDARHRKLGGFTLDRAPKEETADDPDA
ncbi:ribosome biogenesis GTPase YlqF [Levilactobacillus suantsaii]|uniref:Ribosome biogenesis GTPase A n=1 Tax=Levilactobacillus suantsaii TaxID=2292255 RepID=A0A4Q0VK66_9LACO|nr:ribosome biogenesis GTPase YlqF [Levilactobacillus suantsaii]QMU07615.1 ribosome biogenesis GTPase YlqF [Levilactobacillus suantsaii]RXI79559.1 ribosome biogenesis GTPase YlqF [Levilactobacillus suantsaii]